MTNIYSVKEATACVITVRAQKASAGGVSFSLHCVTGFEPRTTLRCKGTDGIYTRNTTAEERVDCLAWVMLRSHIQILQRVTCTVFTDILEIQQGRSSNTDFCFICVYCYSYEFVLPFTVTLLLQWVQMVFQKNICLWWQHRQTRR